MRTIGFRRRFTARLTCVVHYVTEAQPPKEIAEFLTSQGAQ
jgi:hypothetical protein